MNYENKLSSSENRIFNSEIYCIIEQSPTEFENVVNYSIHILVSFSLSGGGIR
jgi:hypothetical protein